MDGPLLLIGIGEGGGLAARAAEAELARAAEAGADVVGAGGEPITAEARGVSAAAEAEETSAAAEAEG